VTAFRPISEAARSWSDDNDAYGLENEVILSKIARKGTADRKTWKRNAKALKKMHGEGRQLRKSKCSCCKGKSEESGGMKLFKNFWAVDWNWKRDFIISNSTVTATARKTTGDKSRRKLTVKYYLPTQQSHIQVCKAYFLSTLGIGAMFVRCTLNKSSSSSSDLAPAHGHKIKSPANKTPSAVSQHVCNLKKKISNKIEQLYESEIK